VLSGYDVVLLYAPPWCAPTRFSKHHLARHLARRGNRVLYVESPLTPLAVRRGRAAWSELSSTLQAPRQVDERLFVRRHFLPVPYHSVTPWTSRRAANVIGQRLLAPVLRRDLARLGFQRPIVIAGLPHAVDLLDRVPKRGVVYHCSDDFSGVRGFPSSLPEVEADLCRRADLVVTTSQTLCEARHHFNPHTYWVPNGVDVAHFSQAAAAADELRALPRPVVGFVGGLSQWVDAELLASLARSRTAWSLVLIGPSSIDLSSLRGLPNVHLLGPRPYADLPRYLAAMDVALVPFKHEAVAWHADPIKVYEYLAAGLPVVSTDLPALHRLGDVVRLANTPSEFLAQVDAAVEEGRDTRRAARQAEAARHTWSSRFERFEQLVLEHVPT
jgi:glycosyltransferase involved in cell wall biosynthesis